ncbi:MAG: hypothetical protein WC310_03965 [Patescibacteria group bacterium]|jgi:hypothetical protein
MKECERLIAKSLRFLGIGKFSLDDSLVEVLNGKNRQDLQAAIEHCGEICLPRGAIDSIKQANTVREVVDGLEQSRTLADQSIAEWCL